MSLQGGVTSKFVGLRSKDTLRLLRENAIGRNSDKQSCRCWNTSGSCGTPAQDGHLKYSDSRHPKDTSIDL